MTRANLQTAAPNHERSRGLSEVLSALSGSPKRLPCKLFYDAEGSRLFEHITRLAEYYPTRTEIEILQSHGAEMAESIGPGAVLVEFGSGASLKTRLLLDVLERPRLYVPIDISREMLLSSAEQLRVRYPELEVRPVVGDYMHELDLPLDAGELSAIVTAFFPGSTIGNFEHHEAVAFLRRVKRCAREGANLLIGVDLPKQPEVLEAAYDDASGVTARFNLNVLRVLNRDYGANFRLADFRHRALWNEAERRVEMHLVCQRDHTLRIGARSFEFHGGEPIVTEHCYKYTPDEFRELAESAGYRVAQVWLDQRRSFSVQRLVPAAR